MKILPLLAVAFLFTVRPTAKSHPAAVLPEFEVKVSERSRVEPDVTHDENIVDLIPELGLKLERSKGLAETLVIDHAQKPSSN